MRILFLTQVLPYPLTSGARIRAYYMLRYLAQQHQITLVSFIRDDDAPQHIDHLKTFCHQVHTVLITRSPIKDVTSLAHSLISRTPLVMIRDRIPAMFDQLRTLIAANPFDIIHADQTSMSEYGLFARDQHPPSATPKTILDQHNAMHLLVKRQAQYENGLLRSWVWQRESRLFINYERQLCTAYDHILTVTDEDKHALLKLFPPAERPSQQHKFTSIPICVDPDTVPPLDWQPKPNQIIHLGTMFWPPNIEGVLWFAQEVLPLIINKIPNAYFIIAGKNPPDSIKNLAAPDSPLHGHVEVTGFVLDPEPLLAQSQLFIVPILAGGGMRVKIVDGWQWGLPIVSTSLGAEGVSTQHGETILIADDAPAFAQAAIQIMQNQDLAEQLRLNGRQWVETAYNWQRIYPQLNTLYQL
ncbi:MAG TPA: glycosyltransferase family 4 protein [Anaerolineae bacterium]|nr:glycosyltransferase family 4 protein [Anaerolineae bacterium]